MSHNLRLLSLMIAGTAIVLVGCSQGATEGHGLPGVQVARTDAERITNPEAPRADVAELAAGNNAFGFDLYDSLSQGDEDFIFSPYSISQALAMAYAGARGETARQMAETLHFTLPGERLHPAFNALDLELAGRARVSELDPSGKQVERTAFQLNLANALWGEKDRRFLPEFLEALAQHYGARMQLMDFENDPEAARGLINQWGSVKTAGRISEILPPNSITKDTKLVLTNAVYFNAPWELPFDESDTQKEAFHTLDGGEVTVDMMHQTDRFGYAEGDGWQAVELPYAGRQVAMLILLPEADRFREVEQRLSTVWLEAVAPDLARMEVELSVPKYRLEPPVMKLNQTLQRLGVRDAFVCDQLGVSDFSGMDGNRELCLGAALHQAFIDVDERRTEAAAVTALEMPPAAGPVMPLRIDRPFIFAIRDRATGSILFLGRVMDPTQE